MHIHRFSQLFTVCLGALLLLWPALWNGFPLLMADTGAHLYAAFEGFVPLDRPPYYGYHVRLLGGSISLWLVVICQAIVVAWAIREWLSSWLPQLSRASWPLLLTALLAFCTPLAQTVSYVLPDAWVCAALLLFPSWVKNPPQRPVKRALYLLLIAISFTFMNSHWLITGMMLSALALTFILVKKYRPFVTRLALPALFWGFAAIVLCLPYALTGKGFVLNPHPEVLLMGKLYESGVLASALATECPKAGWQMCDTTHKWQGNFLEYLWDADNSPIGGVAGWAAAQAESQQIIRQVRSNPVWVRQYARYLLHEVGKQLVTFHHDASYWAASAGSPAHHAVQKHLPNQIAYVQNSRQGQRQLDTYLFANKWLTNSLLALSLLAVIASLILFTRKKDTLPAFMAFAFMIAWVVLGAVVNGSLSGVFNLYGARYIWLVPLAAFFMVTNSNLIKILLSTHTYRESAN